MPYSSVSEIPEYVKKYAVKVQSQWRHVFNTVYSTTNSESRAMKAANSVLKKRVSNERNSQDHFNHMIDRWLGNLEG